MCSAATDPRLERVGLLRYCTDSVIGQYLVLEHSVLPGEGVLSSVLFLRPFYVEFMLTKSVASLRLTGLMSTHFV